MAINYPYTYDAALSGAIASGLSGAPRDTVSADYATLITDAKALAAAIDLQLYNQFTSSVEFAVGPDDALLMLAIVFAYLEERNIMNAGTTPNWTKEALAIAVIFVNADPHLVPGIT